MSTRLQRLLLALGVLALCLPFIGSAIGFAISFSAAIYRSDYISCLQYLGSFICCLGFCIGIPVSVLTIRAQTKSQKTSGVFNVLLCISLIAWGTFRIQSVHAQISSLPFLFIVLIITIAKRIVMRRIKEQTDNNAVDD